jgi:hypothetical protein
MCNWIYKWYKPQKTTYTPEQIADDFISLLENGYLDSPVAAAANEINTAAKILKAGDSKSEKPFLKQLKNHCNQLIELIEEIEK